MDDPDPADQLTADSTTSVVNAKLVPDHWFGLRRRGHPDADLARPGFFCKENLPTGPAVANGNEGLGDAGLVLSNDQFTFKALSATDPATAGQFALAQIPPGHYTLAATAFEYAVQVAQVDVTPGNTAVEALVLPCAGPVDDNTSQITGHVGNLFDPNNILVNVAPSPARKNVTPGMFVTVDDVAFPSAECHPTATSKRVCVVYAANSGDYTVTGLAAGIHTIEASVTTGFESVSVKASVGLKATSVAPTINLPRLDTLTGTVSSNAGGVIAGATVTLYDPQGNKTVDPKSTDSHDRSFHAVTDPAGHYTIMNLTHGAYFAVASAPHFVPATAPDTVPVATTPTLTLALDTDQVANFALDKLAELTVLAWQPSTGATLVPLAPAAATPTATDTTTNTPIAPTAPGSNHFVDLVSGDPVTVTFPSLAAPSCVVLGAIQASACTFTPGLNQSVVLDVVAGAARTAPVSGTLQWLNGTVPQPVPAGGTAVTMQGVVSYTFNATGTAGTANLQNYDATVTAGAFQFPAADVNLSPTADFTVTAPGFQDLAKSAVSTVPGAIAAPFVLIPAPVPVSGAVALVGQASFDDFTGITATVVYTSNSVRAPVTITVAPNGTLTWMDSRASLNNAIPGDYTLTFSKDGFANATVTASIGICASGSCSFVIDTAHLQRKHSTVSGVTRQQIGTGAATPLGGVTVTIVDPNRPGNGYAAVTSSTPVGGADATYAIPNVIDGSYVMTFAKAGFATPAPTNVIVTGDAAGTAVLTVDGTLSPLSHTVTLTVQSAATRTVVGSGDATVTTSPATTSETTGSGGKVSFSLTSGVTYDFTATRAQGGAATTGTTQFTVPISATTTDTVSTPLVLNEGEISGTVVPASLPGASVVVTDVTAATAVTPAPSIDGVTGAYQTFLPLGTYSLTFSATSYNSFTPASNTVLSAAARTARVDAALTSDHTVTVTVMSAVPGASVGAGDAMVAVTPTTPSVPPQATRSDGTVSFSLKSGTTYTFTATRAHFGMATTGAKTFAVPISADATDSVTVTLGEVLISGTTTPHGSAGPVAVTITNPSHATVDTPAVSPTDGSYQSFLVPSSYTVQFTETGYQSSAPTVDVPTPGAQRTDVNGNLIGLVHRVTVTVTSTATGAHVGAGDATVTVSPAGSSGGLTTDAAGTVQFPLTSGITYTFTATRAQGGMATTGTVTFAVPISATTTDTVATPATLQEGQISGTVTPPSATAVLHDNLDQPVDNAAGQPITVTVASDGSYHTALLTFGTYKLVFSAPGYDTLPRPNALDAGHTQITDNPTLTASTHQVTVTVNSAATGAHVGAGDATVTVSPAGSSGGLTTDAAGTVQFPLTSGITYTFTATRAQGGMATTGTVTFAVPISATTTDTVATPATLQEGQISGTVTPPSATAVLHDNLDQPVDNAAGQPITVTVASDGSYHTALLTFGTYKLVFSAPGYDTLPRPNTLDAGHTQITDNPTLTASTHQVTVTVNSAATGAHVGAGDATVTVSPAGSSGGLTTDAAGTVQFPLTSGITYTFTATRAQGGMATTGTVTFAVPISATTTDTVATPATLQEGQIHGAITGQGSATAPRARESPSPSWPAPRPRPVPPSR